jgi:hypothetical protein
MSTFGGSECKPALHVWRRDEAARNSLVPADRFCVCQQLRFMDLAVGSQYLTEYRQPSGTVLAGGTHAKNG